VGILGEKRNGCVSCPYKVGKVRSQRKYWCGLIDGKPVSSPDGVCLTKVEATKRLTQEAHNHREKNVLPEHTGVVDSTFFRIVRNGDPLDSNLAQIMKQAARAA